MKTYTLEEAKQDLDKVLEHAKQGGTVILIGDDDQAYQLVSTYIPKKGPRKAWQRLKGKIKILTDEFYEPLARIRTHT